MPDLEANSAAKDTTAPFIHYVETVFMSVKYPKRTLKKNLNREKLTVTATLLFSRKGHQSTTLDEIASEAGVHVQTLYKHFKTKEELVIASAATVIADCRARFEEKFESHSTFTIWREWMTNSVTFLTRLGLGESKKQQLCAASSLMNDSYLLIVYTGYENLLTEYLAQDFKMDPKTHRLPRLVACMLWSGNEAAMKRCAGLDTEKDILAVNQAVIDESIGVIDDIEKLFSGYIKIPRP